MLDTAAFAARRAAAEERRRDNDAVLIAEARRRVAAGLPATEPGPHDCIQIGDYFLDRRTPPDAVDILRDTVRAEAEYRQRCAARQRIADGARSDATKALLADWSEWEADDARA